MAPTPPKRTASKSPDGVRPAKRLATSSPEEGEVDDGIPSLQPQSKSPSPSRPNLMKPKVDYPFKKRTNSKNGVVAGTKVKEKEKERVMPIVYERSLEDERKIREREQRAKLPPRPHHDNVRRTGGSSTLDHWEPSLEKRTWDYATHGFDRHRDRPYPAWEGKDYLSTASRGHTSRGHRGRSRSSPSPLSRSPPTPSSSRRGKHRLPAHRTPEFNFTPPHRDYNVDRIRDREREMRDHSDENRHYRPNDNRPYRPLEDADRSYRPGGDRHYLSKDWPSEYHREPMDGQDRCHRPAPREESCADDWPHYPDEFRIPVDHWTPPLVTSAPANAQPTPSHRTPPPGTSAPANTQPTPSQWTPPRETSAPANAQPPPSPPAPPPVSSPPPLPEVPQKDGTLPVEHPSVSISVPLKRPAAPRDPHSPAPLPLPVAKGIARKPEVDSQIKEKEMEQRQRRVALRSRKREPVHRSEEEEEKAYGRVFVGCGKQSDYAVTTMLGAGTFGEVHKAVHSSTGKIVALKRILMHNEKEGVPVTALREIKILKAMNHPCIVELLDMFVVRSKGKGSPLSVYMVFPYMDHDLAGLLENERVKLQPSQIKLYMKQLLEGTEYMHRNHVLHRDMKAANLLISNTGSLRIADFGLARAFDTSKERKYTNCVVTRWYRPPELLLGARHYGGEVDLWGIGCVLGEMFLRRPILPGTTDLDQLEKIWQLCGTPNQHSWPNFDQLPGCEGVKRFNASYNRKVKSLYESLGPETVDLMDKLLVCNPRQRITASQALDHDYFWTDPMPADPKTLPTYEASHELDRRGHRNPEPPAHPVHPPHGGRDGRRHWPFPPPPMGQPLHFGRRPQPPLPGRAALLPGPPHIPNVNSNQGWLPPRLVHGRPPYRGQPQPRPDRWQPPAGNRPPGLPPRPMAGLGGPPHRQAVTGRGNEGSDQLNYG